MHPQQQQQQQQQSHIHHHKHEPQEDVVSSSMHCHTNAAYSEAIIAHCHQPTPAHASQQLSQRKHSHSHSHSPHHSRHTSPHSHHSHSSQHSQTRVSGPAQAQAQPQSQFQPQTSGIGHQHHHHYRRRRRQHSAGGSGSLPGAHTHRSPHEHSRHGVSAGVCNRRHRSVADVSSQSMHACQDAACADREVQEIMVRKPCCSSSRTELAQYFAEDLYGSSRRPSSCCTSSDYCYQTDSTSLYGSRSSLSRNNSIKSASAAMRKQRLQQRQPSYTSISLRGLNASRPNSQLGSLTSIFDRAKQIAATGRSADEQPLSPSRGSTLERHSSKGALSNDQLPEYACSPSPIRWSFLTDGKSPTEFDGAVGGGADPGDEKLDAWHMPEPEKKPCRKQPREPAESRAEQATDSNSSWKSVYDEGPSTSSAAAAAARKRRGSSFHCEFEESTTVLFHQEGEAFNNCCNNYIQCNTYLDQDLQITSEDIHQYLSKGNHDAGDVLNNSKNYPFQPSNALEFQYKNNFAAGVGGAIGAIAGSGTANNGSNNNNTNTTNTASSDAGECFQRYERSCRRNSSKETNLNQNAAGAAAGAEVSSCSSTPLSPTNINLSSSTNNINIVFNASSERNANEVKFINNRDSRDSREARDTVVSAEAHHAGYLPYTYPSYDYTNMSANSQFDKPIGIDELPKEFAGAVGFGGASTTSEHSSSLHSPVQVVGVGFDSFDAASEHHLLASHTPLSPASPASPSVNPAGDGYMHMHHSHYDYEQAAHELQHHSPHAHYHRRGQPPMPPPLQSQSHSHTHSHPHSHSHAHSNYYEPHAHDHAHADEQFRLGNALKKVRKRARKYTDFLRKK